MIPAVARFLRERTPLPRLWRALLDEPLPPGVGWPHTLGSAILFTLAVMAVTGVLLALNYSPSPDHARASILYVEAQPFGRLLRGMHHWGASLAIILLGLHLLRTFVWGAYKKPREAVWIAGLLLLLLVVKSGFTGYLLPWDQKAYWATSVGTEIIGRVPLAGAFLQRLVQGGEAVGAPTLTRFFTAHVVIVPFLLAGLVVLHLALMRHAGPAGSWNDPPGGPRPRRFWPDQVFRDAVVAFAVFAVLAGLALAFPAPLGPAADPSDNSYVPRPDWYFLGLFQLLKYFPGRWEPVGSVVLPGLLFALALALPFLDRSPGRSPRERRGILAAGALIAGAIVLLTAMGAADRPPEGAPVAKADPAEGERLFREKYKCLRCHLVRGEGRILVEGPDLSWIAGKHQEAWLRAQILDASQVTPGSQMKVYRDMPPADLDAIVAWLGTLTPESAPAVTGQSGAPAPAPSGEGTAPPP